MANHSSILVWKISLESGGLRPRGRKGLDTTEQLYFHFHSMIQWLRMQGMKVWSLVSELTCLGATKPSLQLLNQRASTKEKLTHRNERFHVPQLRSHTAK